MVSSAESPNDRPCAALIAASRSMSNSATTRPGPPGRRAAAMRAVQPVEEQLAVGQAGQIVVDRVVQDALGGGAAFGDVLEACR